ncbi:MAG TPA: CcoQ/FixQ family Cbb3-type cytochrome c oxidase assembly chaperone [Gammaproteobacteria bacterium]|nr:CcoQ/FixQ family Cbb3-type cytochrome c oxidase assembly chaperone [Gammaproteobacteria bacterium]HAU07289.1 CcoQ/FixQ family Cbb3-type cytochrome c oxidase assembly chaperone [Gammaproteobacteria bacterium]
MTATDWFGLLLTIGIFFALIAIFYWVFHPKNKRRIEGYRHIPFEEDNDE